MSAGSDVRDGRLLQAIAHLRKAVDALATAMGYVSGGLYLLLGFYITCDVLGRRFLGVFSGVTDEISGYVLVVGGMWALAYTLKSGGHVRIDLLLPYLPVFLRTVLDYVALALMGLFAFLLSFYSWRLALDSLAMNAKAVSTLGTPLFLPQALMAVGFGMLALESVIMLGANSQRKSCLS